MASNTELNVKTDFLCKLYHNNLCLIYMLFRIFVIYLYSIGKKELNRN